MLQNLAPDLWILDHPQRLPGGLRMSTRMTIVRLPGGDLWLHSAVPLSDADAAAIDALGPVRHIVAPNLLHHLYLAPARARWPAARVWAPPGLRDKRPDLAIDAHLTGDAPTAWAGAIAALPIDGAPPIAETVFVHRPSATLIVGDLVFAIRRAEGLRTRLAFWLMGVLGGVRQSRAWRLLTRDRPAAAAAAERVLAEPFDRLVPCHGDVIAAGAHAEVERALTWMRRGAERPRLAAAL